MQKDNGLIFTAQNNSSEGFTFFLGGVHAIARPVIGKRSNFMEITLSTSESFIIKGTPISLKIKF